jgi:hypothetical protein
MIIGGTCVCGFVRFYLFQGVELPERVPKAFSPDFLVRHANSIRRIGGADESAAEAAVSAAAPVEEVGLSGTISAVLPTVFVFKG